MYFILFGIIALVSFLVQWNLKNKFEKYGKVMLPNRMTGRDVATKMLHDNGICKHCTCRSALLLPHRTLQSFRQYIRVCPGNALGGLRCPCYSLPSFGVNGSGNGIHAMIVNSFKSTKAFSTNLQPCILPPFQLLCTVSVLRYHYSILSLNLTN